RVVRQCEQVDCRRLEQPLDLGLSSHRLDEGPFDRRSGLVFDVQHARNRMTSLERPMKAGAVPVERDRELFDEKFFNEVRPLPGKQGDRLGRAESVAGAFDVLCEFFRRVARRSSDDAALRVVSVGLFGFRRPRDEPDSSPSPRRRDRGRTARYAGAENENVCGFVVHVFSSSNAMSAAMTEWVSAPMETASGPASAYARTFFRFIPPEASTT